MKTWTNVVLGGLMSISFAIYAHAGPNDMTGRINNAAATSAGFLFTLNSGLPANCAGVYQAWLLVPDTNKSLVALALMALQNEKIITVYTAGVDPATGYCKIDAITGIPWTS